MPLSILLIGAENPRVRDLFREIGNSANVSLLNLGAMPAGQGILSGPTADLVCRKIGEQYPNLDAVVFTWPQLAFLAEKLGHLARIYYCKDPFEQWGVWKAAEIRELESRLLANCDGVFAVSRSLVEDFRPRTSGQVYYLPNGLEDSFFNAPKLPRPANLPTGKPILGCVGQINWTYDWQFIADLADYLPEAAICFVGNISEIDPGRLQEIVHRLTQSPQVFSLGLQAHDGLPAYIQHFDIAMNFLRAGDYADHRSPLRLYDYLATDRPIISTPIREAREHLPHIHIADTGKEAAKLARRILAEEYPVDIAGRRKYIEKQTWACRAKQFLDDLSSLPKIAARKAVQPTPAV